MRGEEKRAFVILSLSVCLLSWYDQGDIERVDQVNVERQEESRMIKRSPSCVARGSGKMTKPVSKSNEHWVH